MGWRDAAKRERMTAIGLPEGAPRHRPHTRKKPIVISRYIRGADGAAIAAATRRG